MLNGNDLKQDDAKRIVNYVPDGETLRDFIRDPSMIVGIRGPFGSGKSTAAIMKLIRNFQMQKPGPDGWRRRRTAIIRQSYPELKSTTIKSWEMWLPLTFGRWREQGPPCHRMINTEKKTDWEVLFIALESSEDVRKLLSLELTDAWINEARQTPQTILDGLTGRIGRYPPMPAEWWEGYRQQGVFNPTLAQVLMDTNPPDTDSWWFALAENDRSTERNRQLHQSMAEAEATLRDMELLGPSDRLMAWYAQPSGRSEEAENLKFLKPGYYQMLMAGKAQDWVKVYVDGDYGFLMDGKPVYPDYRESMHCEEFELIKGLPIRLGLDWGLTPAATISQRLPNGRWLLHREFVSTRMGIKSFADELARILATEYPGIPISSAKGDKSGTSLTPEESTCFQIVRAAGIPAEPGPTNNPERRRAGMEFLLKTIIDGRPALTVHPRCTMVRKGLAGGYHFRKVQVVGSERYRETPEKNIYSHVIEAFEQDVLGAGEDRNVTEEKGWLNDNRPKVADADYEVFSGGMDL